MPESPAAPATEPTADEDTGPPRPARSSRHLLRKAGLLGLAAVGLTLSVAAGGLAWLWARTPDAAGIAAAATLTPSRILAEDGTVLMLVGERTAQPVTLDQVSPHVVSALLATEDRRFHQHPGIDAVRLVAAAWHTLSGETQGASTLTQQLARNLFPRHVGNERSLSRKLRELVVALKIERAYSKDQILALYLNRVPFLYNVTGVEMAARTYFDKPAAQLQAHEAALLVAMLKGPGYYDPVRSPKRALARRDLVLTLMGRTGALDGAAAEEAQAHPLGLRLRRHDLEPKLAPHFAQHVRRQASAWAEANGYDLARDGLSIHTTLDLRAQALAEAAVQRQAAFLQTVAERDWTAPRRGAQPFAELWRERPAIWLDLIEQSPAYRAARAQGLNPEQASARALADRDGLAEQVRARTRLEAGLLALDPRSGHVRAWVGSRDYADDQFDHVALAQRQPGSTFKPFVYGAALRAGVSPWQTFVDLSPQIVLADGGTWSPSDAGGNTGETMTLRTGLAQSRNTITAQVMQRVGAAQVARFARDMGVAQAPLQEVPSLALGTSPVSLLEMVRAYATLSQMGVRRAPVLIERIVDARGIELARFGADPQTVLGQDVAVQLVDMMRDVVDRGTGRLLRTRFELRHDIAGKTGTTQHNADGWFIAMQPDLVIGAWVGFNDPRVTLRSSQWGQGGRNALLLVGDYLQAALRQGQFDPTLRFPSPPAPPPQPAEPPAEESGDGPTLDAATLPAPSVPVPPQDAAPVVPVLTAVVGNVAGS